MKSFRQYTDEIRQQVWPSGEPENLVSAHDLHFQEAFGEVAKWVECEQVNNVNLTAFCRTKYRCGMTVIPAPHGIVRRVYTVVRTADGSDWCDPVFYRPAEYQKVECFGRQIVAFVGQLSSDSKAKRLPLGFMEADAGNDSKCGRARAGLFAHYQGNLYITPWIQSVEGLVVEWDGIKTFWEWDDPVLNEDQDYRKAIKFYFQHAHERDFGDPARSLMFHNPMAMARRPEVAGHFDLALADLMKSCEDRKKVRQFEDCLPPWPCYATAWWVQPHILEPGLPPDPLPDFIIAHIGNIGADDPIVVQAAQLIANQAAVVVVGAGFLRKSSGQYDDTAGQGYSHWIFPYSGSFPATTPATANAFWPAPGVLDWDKDSLASFQQFFNKDRRYYDVCLGWIHFFVLDTDTREPDGTNSSSVQAEWLRVKLALSTARWKVVLTADAPYSNTHGRLDLQWPFKTWGAHLVLSGGSVNYERFLVDGLPYIVMGLTGSSETETPLEPPGPDLTGFRQFDYLVAPLAIAFGKLTSNPTNLKYELIDGTTVVDSIVLT